MTDFYSVGDVSKMVSVSVASIRSYATRYAALMSPTATPAPGQVRRFSDADVRVIAYVYERTAQGKTHEEVHVELLEGALDGWEWIPPAPTEATETASERTDDAREALVPVSQLHAAQVLV